MLVDNQFKYVQGGVVQVLSGSSRQALVAPLQTMSKNGYLYVYVSNESPQDVYFDDVTVRHYTGALVQEQSYYPFGVQMAAISDKALKKNGTPYKYNAGSELEDELSYYNTFYRKYDAQLGRFTGVDIRSEESHLMSVYAYGANNPIFFNDPLGDKYAYMDQNGNKWHGQDPLRGTAGEGTQYRQGWGYDGFGSMWPTGEEGGGGGGNSNGLAGRVDGGFIFRGEMAQNFFRGLMDVYNGVTSQITMGANKNGDLGYWQMRVVGMEPTPWGGTPSPYLKAEFVGVAGDDLKTLINDGKYVEAYTSIFNAFPAINKGLSLGNNYIVAVGENTASFRTGFGTRMNQVLTQINPVAMQKFANGAVTFAALVRQIYHETVHGRLMLGLEQGFIKIIQGDEESDESKSHEAIAHFLMLSDIKGLPGLNFSDSRDRIISAAWRNMGISKYCGISNGWFKNYLAPIYTKLVSGANH